MERRQFEAEMAKITKLLKELSAKVTRPFTMDYNFILSQIEEKIPVDYNLSPSNLRDKIFISAPEDIKPVLYLYYDTQRRKKKLSDPDYINKQTIQKNLGIKGLHADGYSESFNYKHTYYCQMCGKENIGHFCGLQKPKTIEAVCKECNHINIDFALERECSCSICQTAIEKIQTFLISIPALVENAILLKITELKSEIIPDKELSWVVKNTMSDLTKDQRKILDYIQNICDEESGRFNVTKVETQFGFSILDSLKENMDLNRLKQKKLILNKYTTLTPDVVLKTVLKKIVSNFRSDGHQLAGNFKMLTEHFHSIQVNSIHFDARYGGIQVHFTNNLLDQCIDRYIPHFDSFVSYFWRPVYEQDTYEIEKDLFINPHLMPCYESVKKAVEPNQALKSIFLSPAESDKYQFLKNKYPNAIIVPNARLIDLVADWSAVEKELNSDQIKYLKKCKVDFAITDSKGLVQQIIELQLGKHHNNPEWVEKDRLKQIALRILNIPFEEHFG